MANEKEPNGQTRGSTGGDSPRLPQIFIDEQQALISTFLTGRPTLDVTPDMQAMVTAVGSTGPAPLLHSLFVRPAADCELQRVYDAAKGKANVYGVILLKTGGFTGQAAPAPGDSISPFAPLQYNVPSIAAGTLGAFVDVKGKHYILSANHVMAYNGRVPIGNAIVYPGTLDNPTGASVVGSLSTYVPLQPATWPINGSPANLVDCALAELTPTGAMSLAASPAIPLAPVAPGMTKVRKRGRTTHTTTGKLWCDWWGFLDLSFGTFYFEGLKAVLGDGPGPFAAPGDSGAHVVTHRGHQSVGLVMARAYCSGTFTLDPAAPSPSGFIGYVVLICPMPAVLAALASKLGVQPNDIKIKA